MAFRTLKAFGLGLGAAYFFDPVLGARRRSLACDHMISCGHAMQDFVERGCRDLGNRLNGVVAETCASFSRELVDDKRLVARVRATLGHCVSQPHAIYVAAQDGVITLSGTVPSDEIGALVHAIESVRGVRGFDNQLDVHGIANVHRTKSRETLASHISPANWSPGSQLLASAAGLGLMFACAYGRRATGILLGTAGLGLFLRAVQNQQRTRSQLRHKTYQQQLSAGNS